jgi:hypothetical protein
MSAFEAKYGGSKGGGSGSSLVAGGAAGAVAGAIVSGIGKGIANMAAESKAEKAKENHQLSEEKTDISNVVNIRFSDSKEELISQMDQLLMLYSAKKTGFATDDSNTVSDERKKTKKLIFEKLEFGFEKLKRIAPDDAGFIEKKISQIKKKKKALFIFKASFAGVAVLITLLGIIAQSPIVFLGIFLFIAVWMPLAFILYA